MPKSKMFATLAVASLLALAACSQPAQEPTASAPAATESAAPAETAEATPAPEATTETADAAPAAPEMVALEITDASGAQLSGNPTQGQRIFVQCATCHSVNAGENRVGPSLHGIVGRQAGTVPGFRYSEANRTSGITWTEQELFTYLENPQARIRGTIMAFGGLRRPQDRADVIAYLKQQS
jgi:cytochrome c